MDRRHFIRAVAGVGATALAASSRVALAETDGAAMTKRFTEALGARQHYSRKWDRLGPTAINLSLVALRR
jgi:hypothetical protein